MSRRMSGPALALVMIVLTGCSSTAQINRAAAPEALVIEEVAAPATLESFSPTELGSRDAPVKTPPLEAAAPSAAEVAFVASAPSPSRAERQTAGAAKFGPGVTPGVIRIGAPIPSQTVPYNFLYRETFRPNFRRVWEVIADAINSTGGILGRRVRLEFLSFSEDDLEAAARQICTYFTEEIEVVAVAGPEVGTASCLDRAGIVSLSHAYSLQPDFYRRAPHAFSPMSISLERANQLYVDGLYQQGFFSGDHRIGLLRWDEPMYESISNDVVKPALAQYGLEITEEVPITNSSVPEAQAAGWNAVGRLKDAGVDRLLTLDVASYILPEFTDYAEAQNYYPRYGLNSLVGGEWEMERKQLEGSMGIGWLPWVDLEPRHAYREGSEGTRRCVDLMVAAGEEAQIDTYNEGLWSSSICDAALLLKAAIEAGGPSITTDTIVAGAESLDTSFASSNTLVTRFDRGRHEGVGAIRFLRWFTQCGCFRYTSGLIDAG